MERTPIRALAGFERYGVIRVREKKIRANQSSLERPHSHHMKALVPLTPIESTNKILATMIAPILQLSHNKKGDDHELQNSGIYQTVQ